jgi:tetratricopeptide (TPR) repeat protein
MRYVLCAMLFAISFSAFSASLSDAYKDYLNNDYEEALIKAKHLQENDEVLYFLGLTYIKIGNYPEARDYLIKLTKDYPRSKFYEQGLLRLVDAYFLEANFVKAKSSYEEILKKYPYGNYQPLVYLRLIQIANKEGNWQDKKIYLAKLKEKYPQSAEVHFLDSLDNQEYFFTIQVGAFSNIKNSLSLKGELANKYDVYMLDEKREGTMLYKVRVGKFKDRKEAERVCGRLIKQGYPARIYP